MIDNGRSDADICVRFTSPGRENQQDDARMEALQVRGPGLWQLNLKQ
jgi:hypothetical protein